MVAFGHTAVGTIIGVFAYQTLGTTTNSLVGLTLTGTAGFVSHYFFDFLPHGHFFKYKEFKKKIFQVIVFDLILTFLVILSLTFFKEGLSLKMFYVLFGIFGSQLPDVLDGLIELKFLKPRGILKQEHSFHQLVHWHGIKEKALMFSIFDVWQIATYLFAIYIVIK